MHTASRVAAGGARATIVVTGPAGAGKSALAVHIAHLLKGSYPDGQLFAAVGNTPVKDVLGQLLRALGTTDLPTGVGDRRELYQRLCATRAMVVVLDDVRDGRTAVDLHPGSGRHLVLVTNRDAASIHVHNGQSAVLQVRSRPGS
ncbi:AAA family ATPase [Actinokineospora diospyrosa]|uniref:AAA family ATPase n=1 Tax=Actinokineospora diospyrosa TaxID=103728 RepID=UPI0027E2610F|nr:AAA family ATPase [Actinokineospora diospyrosa]